MVAFLPVGNKHFLSKFIKAALKCKQTAEKPNLSDFCDPYVCSH